MPASSARYGCHWQLLKERKQVKNQLPHSKGVIRILCGALSLVMQGSADSGLV